MGEANPCRLHPVRTVRPDITPDPRPARRTAAARELADGLSADRAVPDPESHDALLWQPFASAWIGLC